MAANCNQLFWNNFGSLYHIGIAIRNPDGSMNNNAYFTIYSVAKKDFIDAGLDILALDGVSLRVYLNYLKRAGNTLKKAGVVPVKNLSEDTIRGHSTSKPEVLRIILNYIKAIRDRFSLSQLYDCTIEIDEANDYK